MLYPISRARTHVAMLLLAIPTSHIGYLRVACRSQCVFSTLCTWRNLKSSYHGFGGECSMAREYSIWLNEKPIACYEELQLNRPVFLQDSSQTVRDCVES